MERRDEVTYAAWERHWEGCRVCRWTRRPCDRGRELAAAYTEAWKERHPSRSWPWGRCHACGSRSPLRDDAGRWACTGHGGRHPEFF